LLQLFSSIFNILSFFQVSKKFNKWKFENKVVKAGCENHLLLHFWKLVCLRKAKYENDKNLDTMDGSLHPKKKEKRIGPVFITFDKN